MKTKEPYRLGVLFPTEKNGRIFAACMRGFAEAISRGHKRIEVIISYPPDEVKKELLKSLKQTVKSLEFWFPRWRDPAGVNSKMMKRARAVIAKADKGQGR